MANNRSYYYPIVITTNYYRDYFSGGSYIWGSGSINLHSGFNIPDFKFSSGFSSPAHPLNPFRPAETLAVHIWKLNSEGVIPDAKLIATKSAAVLIIMVLLFNVISRLIASILHKRFTGTKRKSKTTKKVKAA